MSFQLKVAVSALALVLIAAPALIYFSKGPAVPDGEMVAEVLEWESPTDFLLTFSEESLWTELPTVDFGLSGWSEEEPYVE
jgi:hypothetical protein